MKRTIWITIIFILLTGLLITLGSTRQVSALPEYSEQTGEPCATCHISPSGGGQRGPRGQGWVGSGKPGTVPGLMESLELLGVHLDVDESAYLAVPEAVPPAQPLQLDGNQVEALHQRLRNYDGN